MSPRVLVGIGDGRDPEARDRFLARARARGAALALWLDAPAGWAEAYLRPRGGRYRRREALWTGAPPLEAVLPPTGGAGAGRRPSRRRPRSRRRRRRPRARARRSRRPR